MQVTAAGLKQASRRLRAGNCFAICRPLRRWSVCAALVANGGPGYLVSFREQNVVLLAANPAGAGQSPRRRKSRNSVKETRRATRGPLGATQRLRVGWPETPRASGGFDAARLLRQEPAVTEVAELDAPAASQNPFIPRLTADVVAAAKVDYSARSRFPSRHGEQGLLWAGSFSSRTDPSPYIDARNGRSSSRDYGLAVVAQVKLTNSSGMSCLRSRWAFTGSPMCSTLRGRLIRSFDRTSGMVLRDMDLSRLARFQAARAEGSAAPFRAAPGGSDGHSKAGKC